MNDFNTWQESRFDYRRAALWVAAVLGATFVLLVVATVGAEAAQALTKYPYNGYYAWNGSWYCWHDYTFWDRLWSLNANLHDGYYYCGRYGYV